MKRVKSKRRGWLTSLRRAGWGRTLAAGKRRAIEYPPDFAQETKAAELTVTAFRTAVLLVVLLMPRLIDPIEGEVYSRSQIALAALAVIYNIAAGIAGLFPGRFGLRRPFIVIMDMLLITVWMRLSAQWELFPFYYMVVVVAAMWFRVLGGALAAAFCNFFFLLLWASAAGDPTLIRPPILTPAMAWNSALLFLVGCLVGYIAEVQEGERQRRLESQLLIANYQREIDLSMQLQPLLISAQWLGETGETPAASSPTDSNLVDKRVDPNLEIGGAMRLARAPGGGDYFDLIPLEGGRTALCIADVSGKSVRAQARLPLLKYSLRALAPLYPQPDTLMTRLNETLAPDLQPELFIALCCIILDPQHETLSWCNAGHVAPLLVSNHLISGTSGSKSLSNSGGAASSTEGKAEQVVQTVQKTMEVTALETDGPALGMFSETHYTMRSLPWHPSDQLVLFTDGLPDALPRSGAEDGETQVRRLVAQLASDEQRASRSVAQELVNLATSARKGVPAFANRVALLQQDKGNIDPDYPDDITVVVVKYKG